VTCYVSTSVNYLNPEFSRLMLANARRWRSRSLTASAHQGSPSGFGIAGHWGWDGRLSVGGFGCDGTPWVATGARWFEPLFRWRHGNNETNAACPALRKQAPRRHPDRHAKEAIMIAVPILL